MFETKRPSEYRVYTTAFDVEASGGELLRKEIALGHQAATDETPSDVTITMKPVTLSPHLGERPLVTLLVDHSGSLKGAPATWAMTALRQAGRLLEDSGVRFEILAFTTVNWQGGQSRKQWKSRFSWPRFPGRLCDLLHIIYRDADGVYSDWFEALALMEVPGFLKENVDGEALLWAYSRARLAKPDFWLCVVVSDGAPVDDSTLDANAIWTDEDPYPILRDHLRKVIGDLDSFPNVQIAGFGLDYETEGNYDQSTYAKTSIDDPGKLANFIASLISG